MRFASIYEQATLAISFHQDYQCLQLLFATMSFSDELTVQERNKQVVARYSEEFWGKCNPDIVDELCSDDFVSNYPMHGRRQGKIEAKKMLLEFKEVSDSNVVEVPSSA